MQKAKPQPKLQEEKVNPSTSGKVAEQSKVSSTSRIGFLSEAGRPKEVRGSLLTKVPPVSERDPVKPVQISRSSDVQLKPQKPEPRKKRRA